MRIIVALKSKIKKLIGYNSNISPSKAYDLWASGYDHQTSNPLIFLDERAFQKLLKLVNIKGKTIVDIGCGTGRYWDILLTKEPQNIMGCDVSQGMLNMLQVKYPKAITYLSGGESLLELDNESCDLIICNLTIGYIEDLASAFKEWCRILKKEGEIIITDFHPSALQKGANRTMTVRGKLFLIKNYIHTLVKIQSVAKANKLKTLQYLEEKVDENIKHFYVNEDSLKVYHQNYGTSLLYGLHLKKFNPHA